MMVTIKIMLSFGLALGASAAAQTVQPVAPVPRFGPGSPVYQRSPVPRASPSDGPRLGRAGPPGAALPSGQVGPSCMSPLWKMGFHATHVDCPLYLPARPGAVEQCSAGDAAGRVRSVTVTFLDWDAATRKGAVDCHLN